MTFLGSTNEHLVRPEFLAADPTKYSALIAKAQQWDRDSSTLLDGLVMHKVSGSILALGISFRANPLPRGHIFLLFPSARNPETVPG